MRILVSNDDGINAKGIAKLAELAKQFGEVVVVAPAHQCSAMSAKITICQNMELKKASFPVEGVEAYSLDGTPADCVKVALEYLLKEKPDYVFSGMNFGYNTSIETCYSGTVAAAMEGLMKGIPAIAFSTDFVDDYGTADKYGKEVVEKIFAQKPLCGEIWNVNFPSCSPEDCKGILWDRKLARHQYYADAYNEKGKTEEGILIQLEGQPVKEAMEGSDIEALLNGYVSVGKIRNTVFG